jgi:hypothetical protein
MPANPNYPLVRINRIAKAHAQAIVTAIQLDGGMSESMTSWLSDLILAQPMPNGNSLHPQAAPVPAEEES